MADTGGEESFNDDSTSMSLDESSIVSGRRSSTTNFGIRNGNGGGATGNNNALDLSPFTAADSTMSISNMDQATPFTAASSAAKQGSNGGLGTLLSKKPFNLNLSAINNANDTTMNNNNNVTIKNVGEEKEGQHGGIIGAKKNFNWNTPWDKVATRQQLRRATRECSRRGLKLSSRWAAEQLMGLSSASTNQSENDHLKANRLQEELVEPNDCELYAMSLFDLGEYSRAAHVLSRSTTISSGVPLGQADLPPRKDLTSFGIFLRAYCLYLEGERRKDDQITELRDPLERTSQKNTNLPRLEAELRKEYILQRLDGFGLYIYGVVLKESRGAKRGKASQAGSSNLEGHTAYEILVESILSYPYNWSAWLDLGELCVSDPSIDTPVEELLAPISEHWMYHFFCVHVFVENKSNENAIAIIEKLANGNQQQTMDEGESGFFVQSAYLQSQLAMAYYDVRDYDSAHEHFLGLSEREPYRLDHMDAFSNVLYVKDQKVALSHLAHRSITVDKYRPETCIIVGNYYSSKGRHEKAVQYFQRALKLDRSYLSAWTLLGHEYIEMKNTAAAIEAYRRAVDISEREYRAWYGLGQTYEIMNMLLHALFYFRKAAALHPHDARMWCAIGGCLLGLDRRSEAEKSYERAVSLGDGEGIATRKLAELYREDGDEEKAAKCFLRHLELRYQSQLPGSVSTSMADSSPEAFEMVVSNVRVDEPEAEALLYLAYYYRDNMEYDQAVLCATRLEDYPGPEKEQGKSLLRDVRSRMDQRAGRRKGRSRSPAVPSSMRLRSRDLSLSSRSSAGGKLESSFEFSP